MRQTAKGLAISVAFAIACLGSTAKAAFFSYPRGLTYQLNQISFMTPALAPMAHVVFCLR